jgi:hypothetical protein
MPEVGLGVAAMTPDLFSWPSPPIYPLIIEICICTYEYTYVSFYIHILK